MSYKCDNCNRKVNRIIPTKTETGSWKELCYMCEREVRIRKDYEEALKNYD